jgi:hypothetical protein
MTIPAAIASRQYDIKRARRAIQCCPSGEPVRDAERLDALKSKIERLEDEIWTLGHMEPDTCPAVVCCLLGIEY